MEIRTTYIGNINGVSGVWCGFKPEEADIIEEHNFLCPKDGCILENVLTRRRFSTVLLRDNDSIDNYIEIEVDNEGIND